MSDELVEALAFGSLTVVEQDFIEKAVKELRAVFNSEGNPTNEVAKIIWRAVKRDRKVRFEKLEVKPGDLVLAKFDTESLSGGAELHHFARGLKDMLPDGTPFIILQNDAQLETLDETHMKNLGWQPVPEDEKNQAPESRGPG